MITSSLEKAYGNALFLQERAFFFAKSLPKNITLASEVANFGLKSEKAAVTEQDVRRILKHINIIYGTSGTMLRVRLKNIADVYKDLHKPDFVDQHPWLQIVFGRIRWPDRDEDAVNKSRDILKGRYKALIKLINNDINATPPLKLKVLEANCNKHWNGLTKICHLYMEEITHTSGRVDYMNGVLSTKRSLLYAIIGIFVSVLIAAFPLLFSSTNKPLENSLATIATSSVAIQHAMETNNFAIPDIHAISAAINSGPLKEAFAKSVNGSGAIRVAIDLGDNQPSFSNIQHDLESIAAEIKNYKISVTPPQQAYDTVIVQNDIKNLQERISVLEIEIHNNTFLETSTSRQNIEAVISELKKLDNSLKKIENAIKNKKLNQINKKALINVEDGTTN